MMVAARDGVMVEMGGCSMSIKFQFCWRNKVQRSAVQHTAYSVMCTSEFVEKIVLMLSVLTTNEKQPKGNLGRKFWEVSIMSITLIEVMVLWVFAYVQICKMIPIIYVKFFAN